MAKRLFYNGTIRTMDDDNPKASALLINGNRIEAAIDRYQEYLNREDIEKTDLAGKTVLPGFNDNHLHLNFFGEDLRLPDLTGLNENEIAGLLREYYKFPKKNEILYGRSWDYPACSDPRKEILDKAFPDNPVILSQYGGHSMWVNTFTLKKMKITKMGTDPDNKKIIHDKNGEITGIVKDMEHNRFLAGFYIKRLKNKKSIIENHKAALHECAKYGITSVQDNTWSFVSVNTFRQLFRTQNLTARVSCWAYGSVPIFRTLFYMQRFNRDWYSKGQVKYFLDGTFTAKTAWLTEPYAGEPENCGFGKSREYTKAVLEKEIRRKIQSGFHAIGDRTVHEFLEVIKELSEKYAQICDLRIRLEHAQLIRPDDIPLIKKYGICIAAQPAALNNPQKDIRLLGEKRALQAYPYRSLLDAGVPLSFGSDAPAEGIINPFEGIHLAVNREGPERISAEEALKCYTAGSAYAEFRENENGILSKGKLADFIIVSDDPLNTDPAKIRDIKVHSVFTDGNEVYTVG